ncbi:hypothetical protein F2P45_23025 [Massilia sp. CCM 8733]|uniref:Uncharacterized protein n=1 Tax=Massilia mucilaginosa TaxID=2609282 RepID=A0ABX0NY72_9BURK|nr:hypothetical protein [Massilia mucilaginosa]NHZ91855.1 hypothetical protein [Massilia mucilaginosa]
MAGLTPRFALTGDAELDDAFPSHPRLLGELAVAAIDDTRLMLVGGLGAPVVGRRFGALDVLAFLRQLDGTRTLEQLCADHLAAAYERKRLLCWLQQHGLLEQPAGPMPAALDAHTCAFLAKVMNQTRIHRRRSDAAAAFLRPIGMLGAGRFRHELSLALQGCGLNVVDCMPGAPPCGTTIAVLDGTAEPDAQVARLQAGGAAVLLVRARALSLDVGPLLANRGCCTMACYRAAAGAAGDGVEGATLPLWAGIACHAVMLLNSGAAPFSLLNNFLRYQLDNGHIGCGTHPVARLHALDDSPCAIAAADRPASLHRLERHSRAAVPPRRMIGVKSYEQHYAPKNILAARQFPLPHGAAGKAISMANATAPQRLLLQLITRAFGYWSDAAGNRRRICPSGGNLGAAECLVVWRDQARRRTRLMRYVPVVDWIEPLAEAPLDGAGRAEYEIVCLANTEKIRQKYGDSGLSLGLLDSGFGAAFLQAAALVAGHALTPTCTPFEAHWLRDIVEHRRHYYNFAWRADLPPVSAAPVQWDRFDRLLRQRSAARDCSRLDLAVPDIAALLRQARPRPGDPAAAALLSSLHPILVIERAGVCATYEWEDDGGLRPCPGSTLSRDGPDQELLSQRNLSQAAGRLFMLADLARVLRTQGPAGHDQLLTLIGQWIGSFWLAIESRRLRGCPSGAAVESDLLNHLPPSCGHLFNLFAFTFGNARESTP